MSIKSDEKDQLDSEQGLNLQFKGNELIAIGEEQIQNDLDEQQPYKGTTKIIIFKKKLFFFLSNFRYNR